MSEEKDKPKYVPQGASRKRYPLSPLMQEIVKLRRQADREDAVIVAEAERVWAEMDMPEEGRSYIGPVEHEKKGESDA